LTQRVSKQSFLALSSAEAELGGILSGAVDSLSFVRLFEWLGYKVYWRLGADSSAARAVAMREGLGKCVI